MTATVLPFRSADPATRAASERAAFDARRLQGRNDADSVSFYRHGSVAPSARRPVPLAPRHDSRGGVA